MEYIEPIMKLVNEFSKLPAVGARTALKYAYHIITSTDAQVQTLVDALLRCKQEVKYCTVCGNFTDRQPCAICTGRNSATICVVKEPKDVFALEKVKDFKGTYHVLHGTINPMEGIGPDQLNIKSLLLRIANGGVQEIIVATNPDVEGEATAMYLARLLKPLGVVVSRIAHGIPLGSELEYTDEITLQRALQDRKQL